MPTRGQQCPGRLTHLLEPQVGLHDLVHLVLEREVRAQACGAKRGAQQPGPHGLALTTFTSWDMDTSNWMMTASDTLATGRMISL